MVKENFETLTQNNFENFVENETRLINQSLHIALYSVIAFTIPVILKHNQIIVGTIINTLLFLSAKNLQKYDTLPIIFLPSIGAFLGGFLFENLTSFLIYLIPGIWLGNLILVFGYKQFRFRKNMNKINSSLIAILLKTFMIGTFSVVLFLINIIPAKLLLPMSILQFVTASIGGVTAETINKFLIKSPKVEQI